MLFPTELEVRARDNKIAKNEAEAKKSVGGIKEGGGLIVGGSEVAEEGGGFEANSI